MVVNLPNLNKSPFVYILVCCFLKAYEIVIQRIKKVVDGQQGSFSENKGKYHKSRLLSHQGSQVPQVQTFMLRKLHMKINASTWKQSKTKTKI